MRLECNVTLAAEYRSPTQAARVITEDWCARELYCPACDCDRLAPTLPNTRAIDFTCPQCSEPYQLKSGRAWDREKVVDAAYSSMMAAIRGNTTPNLLLLQYSNTWCVRNLVVISKFFFTESTIEARPPLRPGARRSGWIGCNILVSEMPPDGKIKIVQDGIPLKPATVRREFQRIQPLRHLDPGVRGWTLDVLQIIRKLNKKNFSLSELYAFHDELQHLHPKNRNIRPKMRQQLQVLRDLQFLTFTGPGQYRMLV